MSGHPGYYSLIQYCPDSSRAEAANVGVLLFCPAIGFLEARTAGGNDRVRRFFRGRDVDIARLNTMKRSIERRLKVEADRFKTLDDLVGFIESRGNDIVLTAPRPMKVAEPRADLTRLFAELVGGRVLGDKQAALIPEMDGPFARLSQEGRLQIKERVRVPLLGTTIRAPYSYRNGVVNLIKPHRFSGPEDDARRSAGHLAIEGDLLKKHPHEAGGDFRLVVVSAMQTAAAVAREDMLAPLFHEYGVKFVRRSQVSEFVQQVQRDAHA